MQFSFALIAATALAVANAVIITNGPASFVGITAGKALNISWASASGPVTLTLKDGEANALKTFSVIASGLSGTSYAWSIPANLPSAAYALQIDDSTGVPNYSVQFQITGGPSSSSSSASGSSTSSDSSAATSTATSASASASASAGSNSTVTSARPTASQTASGSASRTGSATGTSTASAPPNTNSGASFASPLAFVLLAFAALMTLN